MATFYYKRYRWFTKRPKSKYVAHSTSLQTLTQTARWDNQQTYNTHAITVGAVNLAPALWNNSQTFNTHTVSHVLPQATRFDNSQTYNTHTLTVGAVNLAASKYDNAQTYNTHTLTVGAVNLSASIFNNSQTYNTHTLTPGAVTLTVAKYDNSQTYNTHTLTVGAVNLSPSLFTNDQTYNTHTISGGAASVAPDRFDNAQTYVTHTITTGAVSLTPSLFSNSQTFNTHTITVGAVTLTPSLFTNDQTYYTPTVVGGTVQDLLVHQVLENTVRTLENFGGTNDVIRDIGTSSGGTANARQVGMTFTTSTTMRIKNVGIKIAAVGAPPDEIYIRLWSRTGTTPEEGSILAVSNEIEGVTFDTGGAFKYAHFTFADTQVIEPGNYAFTILRQNAPADANYFQITEDADQGFANGTAWRRQSFGVWVELATDWCFFIDEGVGQTFYQSTLTIPGAITLARFDNAQTYNTHTIENTQLTLIVPHIKNQVVSQAQAESSLTNYGTTAIPRLAQTFQVPYSMYLRSIRSSIAGFGRPSDAMVLEVRTFSATPESGTLLATSYPQYPTGNSAVEFFFDPFVLSPSTQYEIIYKRTGSLDDANYYELFHGGSSSYADGSGWAFNGTTWTEQSHDYRFNAVEYISEIFYPPSFTLGPAPPILPPLIQNNKVIDQTTGTSDYAFGHTTDQRLAQEYVSPVIPSMRVRSITLEIYKVGNPADQIYLTINNVTGDPDNSGDLAVSTSVAGTTISSNSGSRSTVDFYFPPNQVQELQGAHWFFKIQRTGALDASNYYVVTRTTTDAYANGAAWTYDGSWHEQTTDLKFSVEEFFSVGFYKGTITLYLTPDLWTNTQTFYTPKIDLIIFANRVDNAQTFYTPSIGQGLRPSLVEFEGIHAIQSGQPQIVQFGGSSNPRIAQSFTVTETTKIKSVLLLMNREASTDLSEQLVAELRSFTTDPDDGTVLATSTLVPAAILTTGSFNNTKFTFNPSTVLTPGVYNFTVRTTLGASTNLFNALREVSDIYAGGTLYREDSVGNWTDMNTDLTFVVFNVEPLTVYTPKVSYILHAQYFEFTQEYYTPKISYIIYAQTFTNTQLFNIHTVNSIYPLTAPFFTNTQTFFTSIIDQNITYLTADLIQFGQTFYTPSVGSLGNISPTLFTNTQTYYQHRLTVPVIIIPEFFNNSLSFTVFTHDMREPADQEYSFSRYDNQQAFYAHTIKQRKTFNFRLRRGRVPV